jgi:cytidylate kinase
VIAIDGPTAAGKSTVALGVAQRLGFRYIETGAMYRSVALAALRRGVSLDDDDALTRLAADIAIQFEVAPEGNRVLLDGEDVTEAIRAPEVSAASSQVSVVAGVRAVMVARQRALASDGGVVMEGRDIGTVVLPDADVKVFLNASLEARARRRHAELLARRVPARLEDVLREEADRDRRDETRHISPLRPAPDGVVIDSTTLQIEQVVEEIVSLVRERVRDG